MASVDPCSSGSRSQYPSGGDINITAVHYIDGHNGYSDYKNNLLQPTYITLRCIIFPTLLKIFLEIVPVSGDTIVKHFIFLNFY